MKKIVIAVAMGILLTFSVSCGKPKENKEVETALRALRKVQAATQVGVNYQQYGITVIDAKAAVNEVIGTLPGGDLKKELIETMDAYTDVNAVWGVKIGGQPSLYSDNELGKRVIAKYSIPVTERYGLRWADIDSAMQLIWLAADSHLDAADKAYKKSLQ